MKTKLIDKTKPRHQYFHRKLNSSTININLDKACSQNGIKYKNLGNWKPNELNLDGITWIKN